MTGMLKDPVCKMMVDEKTAKHVSEAGGKKVYLCSAACKIQFDASPKNSVTRDLRQAGRRLTQNETFKSNGIQSVWIF
jgi:YHS domain-containing protein